MRFEHGQLKEFEQRLHKRTIIIVFIIVCSSLLAPSAIASVFSVNNFSHYSSASSQSSSDSGYVMVQYPLPTDSKWPFELATDNIGRVWVVEQLSNQLGMFNPSNDTWTEYAIPTPDSTPNSVAIDSSGNVWVTGLTSNKLIELRNDSNRLTEYSIPNGTATLAGLNESLICGPVQVYVGPHQNIWVICDFSNQIDEFFPGNSTFDRFNLPLWYSGPVGLAFDSSGNFWFTAADANELGYANVSQLMSGTSNGITEFAPKNQTYDYNFAHEIDLAGDTQNITSSLPTPAGLAFGPDGLLWITEHVDSSFDSYNISSKSLDRYWLSKTYMEYGYPISFPNGLAVDSNGNVWMAEHYGNKVAEYSPSTRTLTEYAVPCCSDVQYAAPGAGIYWLALGKGGVVWFVEIYGNRIGELIPNNSTQTVLTHVGDSSVSLLANQRSSVTLPVKIEYSGVANSELKLAIAGTSHNGTLVGARAVFAPESFNISGSGTVSSNLTLVNQALKPGIYDLTVSANLTNSNVIYSTIFEVNVTRSQFPTLIVYAAIVGVVASATIIAVVSRRRVRRRR